MQNLKSLQKHTQTKNSAVSFLQEAGILHKQRQCTRLHEMKLCLTEKGDRWRCDRRSCRTEVQLKCGTWLEGVKLPYQKICEFVYCWAYEMTSIAFCRRELGIMSDETVVDWNNYIREVCAEKLLMEQVCIGGEGLHVEIDESLFVRRKYNVGRAVRQQWVFGGVCRETGECFIYAVNDRSSTTLLGIIKKAIMPGTTIISDQWRAYNGIEEIMKRDYRHIRVNHSEHFVDPISGACTNSVESLWGKAKARNKRHWGTHTGMIDSYLCEFMWRRKYGQSDVFSNIIRDIVLVNPLP